jgi:hypothetical protein
MPLIWGEREGIYFCRGVWTGQITLIWFEKLVFWRIATWSENAAWSSVVKAHCVVGPAIGAPSGSAAEKLHQYGSEGRSGNVVSLTFQGEVLRIAKNAGRGLYRVAQPHIRLLAIHDERRNLY